jgi:hypothetical protein
MAAMPATAARRPPAPAFAGSWWRLAVWTLTVAGLIAMHQLAGLGEPAGHHHAADAHAAAVTAMPEPCPDVGMHCPDDSHSHPHQVCQPSPPSQHSSATPPLLPLAVAPVAVAATPVLPRTAADDAADGSGCGPPVLAQLSILRI